MSWTINQALVGDAEVQTAAQMRLERALSCATEARCKEPVRSRIAAIRATKQNALPVHPADAQSIDAEGTVIVKMNPKTLYLWSDVVN